MHFLRCKFQVGNNYQNVFQYVSYKVKSLYNCFLTDVVC